MALPSVYAKVTMVLSSPQKNKFYNIFYFTPAGTPTWTLNPMQDSADIAAAIRDILELGLPSVLSTSCHMEGVNCELHKADQIYDTSVLSTLAGIVTGDELADFEAVVLQKRTSSGGKSGRGRWYLGPVPESLTNENYITPAAATVYNTLASNWQTPAGALGQDWYQNLYSKKNQTLDLVTSIFPDPKIGSIGGRKSHSIL